MNKIDFLTAVNNSQRCQRNWDLSKEVDDETIAWLMEIGYSTATKQNLDTFEVVCIKDRSVIQEFTKAATNPDYNRDLLGTGLKEQMKVGRNQNPQTDSNLLFLFFHKPEVRTSDIRQYREGCDPEDKIKFKRNTAFEMGMSASAIAIGANSVGMKSGFCRCVWNDILPKDILDQHNLDRYDLEIMLGVGYPLYDTHTLHTDNIHTSESLVKYTPRKLII